MLWRGGSSSKMQTCSDLGNSPRDSVSFKEQCIWLGVFFYRFLDFTSPRRFLTSASPLGQSSFTLSSLLPPPTVGRDRAGVGAQLVRS